ncbi:MAG: protein kinase [Myxococcaceae bacterium]|nr:protein kinase [Myxococcaceae bacterium]
MAGDAIETVKAEDFIGQVLDGRYRIESVLGHGGMGMVFKAVQTSMSRPVAVKLLHPQLALAPTFFERFKREAEVASRLHHPNIITIFDFGRTTEGACYYVMELLEGESLRQQVRREGPMSLRRAAAILEQVALGLSHAHRQNVVHRDLKPHNIMLSEVDGAYYVKVLDFGLVKAMEAEDEEQLTSTGQVLGTPQYMPPEQASGEAVDQRSDLYSLAGVLYFCLAGTSPFGANTVRKALTAALTKPVPPIGTHRKGAPLPRAIDELIRKGMAKEKEDRYQSCEELVADLQAALKGLSDEQLDARPGTTSEEAPKKDSGSQSGASPSKRSASSKASPGSRPNSKAVSSVAGRALPKGEPKVEVKPEPKASSPSDLHRRATAPDMPSTPLPSIAPSRHPLYLGLGLAAVAVVGVVIYLVLGSSPPPAPTAVRPAPTPPTKVAAVAPTPAPTPPVAAAADGQEAPAQVRVKLETKPSGASVLEDGVLIGKTPIERAWPRDEAHQVTFQLGGFVDSNRTFRLAHDDTFTVDLTPARKAAAATGKGPKKKEPETGIEAFE